MNNNLVVPQVLNGRILTGTTHRHKQLHYEWTCEKHPDSHGVARLKDIRKKQPRCCWMELNRGPTAPNWKGTGILGAKKYHNVKRGATARREKNGGIEFSVTPEDLIEQWNYQQGRCFYSNRDLVDINSSEASVDRINSSLGYVKGNVHWVHKDVNLAKQQLTSADFIALVVEISQHIKNHAFEIKDVLDVVEVGDDRSVTLKLNEDILAQYGVRKDDPRFRLAFINAPT